MKTHKNATPRPWEVAVNNPHCILAPSPTGLCIVATLPKEGSQLKATKANAALIVQAVNEREALLAVVESASWLLDEFRSRTALIETCDLDPDELAAMNKTEQALSTLSKLRESEASR